MQRGQVRTSTGSGPMPFSNRVKGRTRLVRIAGRNTQMLTHPTLAATYAQLGRQQDADGERAIVAHLWPLLDARIFAAQFGTQEARDQMLDGLRKAGFR